MAEFSYGIVATIARIATDDDLREVGKAVIAELKARGEYVVGMERSVELQDTDSLIGAVRGIYNELKHRGEEYRLKDVLPANVVAQLVAVDLNDVEKALAESGRKITAIKELRSRTGMSLKDAKDQVDAYYNAWLDAGKPLGGIPKPHSSW